MRSTSGGEYRGPGHWVVGWSRASLLLMLFACLLAPLAHSSAPATEGPNPRAEDAISAILAAYDSHEFVAIPAAHGAQDLDQFLLQLIRDPRVPGRINAIVMECGNSLYQPILDRYLAGDDVPIAEVQKVWRNTTQAMCGTSPFFPEFYELVRRVNSRLPDNRRIRVLGGDPPIDWDKVKTAGDVGRMLMRRDLNGAEIAQTQIQAKHLNGLLLYGTGHIKHTSYIVSTLEKDHPGSVFVVTDYRGFYTGMPQSRYNSELERRAQMASWRVPSIAPVKGTWLADLPDDALIESNSFFGGCGGSRAQQVPTVRVSQTVDAILYLGPRDLLLHEARAAYVFLEKSYMAELQRRDNIFNSGMPNHMLSAASEDSVQGVLRYDSYPFFYNPQQMQARIAALAKLNAQLRRNCPATQSGR